MKCNDKVKMIVFGEEKEFTLCFVGYDLADDAELGQREEALVKWILENFQVENYTDQIAEYYNNIADEYEFVEKIIPDELNDPTVLDLYNIVLTSPSICDIGDDIPDISVSGDSDCSDDDGIAICFRDHKFLCVDSESNIL